MLQVNTQKISVDDFAKEYGFVKSAIPGSYYLRRNHYVFFEMTLTEKGELFVFGDQGKIVDTDTLFDMFSKGYLIKTK